MISTNPSRRRAVVLMVAALGLALTLACGGGGDSTTPVTPVPVAKFTPDAPNPGTNSVTLQPGTDGTVFTVKVSVKDVTDFFGGAFTIDYDRFATGGTTAQMIFLGANGTNSFLKGAGVTTSFLFSEGVPGVVQVSATRIQNAGGTVPGVNVGSTPQELCSLSFQAVRAMSAAGIAFGGNLVVCTSQVQGAPPVCVPVTVSWTGGKVTTQ